MTAFWVYLFPPTVVPFNLVHAVVINAYVDISWGFELKLDPRVTGALGVELEKSLPTFLHFAFFASVFRIKTQFCKITCEVQWNWFMARIPFAGAYCSNYFNWSDADFELRLKESKTLISKWHSKDPLTW